MEFYRAGNAILAANVPLDTLLNANRSVVRKQGKKATNPGDAMFDEASRVLMDRETLKGTKRSEKLGDEMIQIDKNMSDLIHTMYEESPTVRSAISFIRTQIFSSGKILVLDPDEIAERRREKKRRLKAKLARKKPKPPGRQTPPYMRTHLFTDRSPPATPSSSSSSSSEDNQSSKDDRRSSKRKLEEPQEGNAHRDSDFVSERIDNLEVLPANDSDDPDDDDDDPLDDIGSNDFDLDGILRMFEHPDEEQEELTRVLGSLGDEFLCQILLTGIAIIGVPSSNSRGFSVFSTKEVNVSFVDHVNGDRTYFASMAGVETVEEAKEEKSYFVVVAARPDRYGRLTGLGASLIPSFLSLELKEAMAEIVTISSLTPDVITSIRPLKSDSVVHVASDVAALSSDAKTIQSGLVNNSHGSTATTTLGRQKIANEAAEVRNRRAKLLKSAIGAEYSRGSGKSHRLAVIESIQAEVLQPPAFRKIDDGYEFASLIQATPIELNEDREQFRREVAQTYQLPDEFWGGGTAKVAMQVESATHIIQTSLARYKGSVEQFLTWIMNCRYKKNNDDHLMNRQVDEEERRGLDIIRPPDELDKDMSLFDSSAPRVAVPGSSLDHTKTLIEPGVGKGVPDNDEEDVIEAIVEEKEKQHADFAEHIAQTIDADKRVLQVKIMTMPTIQSILTAQQLGVMKPEALAVFSSLLTGFPVTFFNMTITDPVLEQKAQLEAGLDTIRSKNQTKRETDKLKKTKELGLGPAGRGRPGGKPNKSAGKKKPK